MSEILTNIHFDPAARKVAFERVQDVEPILERNKYLRTLEQKSDWGRHIGTIPNVILEKWFNEEWERGNKTLRMFTPEFDLLVQEKLCDPEWAYLRTDKKNSVIGYS